MNLKYKILWIEDEITSIKIKVKKTRSFLEQNYGFECQDEDIEIVNYDEFKERYTENEELRTGIEKFDLLLVDFDLGEKEKHGDELIKIIRNSLYSEILFYSSNKETLTSKINEHSLEGVFISNRSELESKIKKLIEVTIKKVQDVNNLRGLIMAEVAELDRIKKRIIQKYNQEADTAFKKYIKEDVFSKIKKDLESLKCLVKVEDSKCSHDEINLEELQKNFFYDTFKKSRTVYKIKRKKCNHIDFKHEDYKKHVIDKRNVLAHEEAKTRESDGVTILKYPQNHEKKDFEFTEEHCVKIRKDIKKYKQYLEDIEKALIHNE